VAVAVSDIALPLLLAVEEVLAVHAPGVGGEVRAPPRRRNRRSRRLPRQRESSMHFS
jgi:hypothetical protein